MAKTSKPTKPATTATCKTCREWTETGTSRASGNPFGTCALRRGSTVGAGHSCPQYAPAGEATR